MKNDNKIIGKFYGITFANQVFEFIVKEDDMIYCDQVSKELGIKTLVIKPNFEVFLEEGRWTSYDSLSRATGGRKVLIGNYHISPELVQYLSLHHMILYSTDMAYLYHLDPEYAYDKTSQTRAFKHVKDNTKRLVKQKQGIFH